VPHIAQSLQPSPSSIRSFGAFLLAANDRVWIESEPCYLDVLAHCEKGAPYMKRQRAVYPSSAQAVQVPTLFVVTSSAVISCRACCCCTVCARCCCCGAFDARCWLCGCSVVSDTRGMGRF